MSVFVRTSCSCLALVLAACGSGGGGGGSTPAPPPPVTTDTTAPDTTLAGAPAALSNTSTATFTFASTEAGSTFEARLDGAAFATATSPRALTGLADGSHTFEVRARDAAGNVDATPASATWTVDTTAPETTLSSAPASLTPVALAAFTFSSPDAAASFEVSLDDAAFVAAASPYSFNATEGAHTLRIRARDAAGNVDGTPVSATWVVDTVAPETTLASAPTGVTTVALSTFTFSSTDTTAVFEVSLDNSAFVAVSSPYSFNATEGAHTLRIRARDAAGNVDATPPTVSWTVDTTAPETQFTSVPSTPVSSASFSFSSNETPVTFEVSLDNGAFVAATSPHVVTGHADGAHTLRVRARDSVGHIDATPASATFTLDTVAPTAGIVFPPPVSYTEGTTLTVRGTASDANGVSAVSVNGVAATSTTNFSTWSATIPVSATGANPITVSVTDRASLTTAAADTATVHNRGPTIQLVQNIAFDPTGDQLLVVDQRSSKLLAFSAATGIGRILADLAPLDPQPDATFIGSIAVDTPRNRAIVAHGSMDRIAAVNLTTGVITVLSASGASATRVSYSPNLALDTANNRAYVTGDSAKAVAVDLATGGRSVVSGGAVGGGVALDLPGGIAYDAATNPGSPRLLVSDLNYASLRVVAIDIATGTRQVFSSSSPNGSGPALISPHSLQLDAANNRLLVLDIGAHSIMAVALDTGNRSYLAGGGVGSGPLVNPFAGLALSPAGRVYSGQIAGEILQLDLNTSARTIFAGTQVGSGPRILEGRAIVRESANTLLYLDWMRESVIRVNLQTGNRTVVSSFDTSIGSGPQLMFPTHMIMDTTSPGGNTRVIVAAGNPSPDTLISVDLGTGNRSVLASLNSAVPAISQFRAMAIDAGSNRVLFLDNDNQVANADALYAVDLTTGVRSIVSDNVSVGTGPAFALPVDLVLEPAVNPTRAIVSNMASGFPVIGPNFLAVDLATGNRSIFAATSGAPGGIAVPMPTWLRLDSANARIIGLNAYPEILYSMPLAAPVRGFVSGVSGNNARGTGLRPFGTSLEYDNATAIAYAFGIDQSLMAMDMASGDRVQISH